MSRHTEPASRITNEQFFAHNNRVRLLLGSLTAYGEDGEWLADHITGLVCSASSTGLILETEAGGGTRFYPWAAISQVELLDSGPADQWAKRRWSAISLTGGRLLGERVLEAQGR